MKIDRCLLWMALMTILAPCVWGVPEYMEYRGTLMIEGSPVANQSVPAVVRIYDNGPEFSQRRLLWSEWHTLMTDNEGVFSLLIGAGHHRSGIHSLTEAIAVTGEAGAFLDVTLNYPGNAIVLPGMRLQSVPLAVTAGRASAAREGLTVEGDLIVAGRLGAQHILPSYLEVEQLVADGLTIFPPGSGIAGVENLGAADTGAWLRVVNASVTTTDVQRDAASSAVGLLGWEKAGLLGNPDGGWYQANTDLFAFSGVKQAQEGWEGFLLVSRSTEKPPFSMTEAARDHMRDHYFHVYAQMGGGARWPVAIPKGHWVGGFFYEIAGAGIHIWDGIDEHGHILGDAVEGHVIPLGRR